MRTTVGELIREAREASDHRWSQEYLGQRVGVSGATISRWELGHKAPSLRRLEALADVLGIPRDDLISAAGVNLHPPPERRLYPKLAEFLAAYSVDQQKAILRHLEELAEVLARR